MFEPQAGSCLYANRGFVGLVFHSPTIAILFKLPVWAISTATYTPGLTCGSSCNWSELGVPQLRQNQPHPLWTFASLALDICITCIQLQLLASNHSPRHSSAFLSDGVRKGVGCATSQWQAAIKDSRGVFINANLRASSADNSKKRQYLIARAKA